MNVQHPPVRSPRFDGPPNDLDRLLSAFMRAELPDPWPMLRPPAAGEAMPLPAKRWRWSRLGGSRFALAATITLCLVGSLIMSHHFPREMQWGLDRSPEHMVSPRNVVAPPQDDWKSTTEKTRTGRKVKVYQKGDLEKTGFTIVRVESEGEE
jgi:hypothetical protein